MKEEQGLTNYLTNIILRPHRQIYGIEKLGPSKIVVKSNQKSIQALGLVYKKERNLPKYPQINYCELIQVNRRQVTIRSCGKNVQASIYEPQLTTTQKTGSQHQRGIGKNDNHKQSGFHSLKNIAKSQKGYQNCVIFLHANSGSRLQGIQYAKHVLQYRTLCVSFDYTGSGISEGQYTTMGVYESKDLSAVINFIATQYQVSKFSLWGRSMGAVTATYYLLTAYKQDSKLIKITSCIMDSPFSNLQQLVLQLASKKSNLPQFLFQPLLTIMERDITSKLGVNIFTELNLIDKIKNLNPDQIKLISSVRFLGLASKQDKMIDHQHCQKLCSLLIPQAARNSELLDQKYLIERNPSDKHLTMLMQLKKQINSKGDFIYIEGDHNKPRGNEVKQKISLFIEESFKSHKDIAYQTFTNTSLKDIQQTSNSINFSKTGLKIKTKLSFAKSNQNNTLKSRRESYANNQRNQQNKEKEPIPSHNYNQINLKDIQAMMQTKKSLSKEKGASIRNSLSKSYMLKQRKQIFQQNQNNNKGIKIVSKQHHRDRNVSNQQNPKFLKKACETLPKSNQYQQNNQSQRSNIPAHQALANLLSKGKSSQNTPKHKYENTSNELIQQPSNPSQSNGSVNNSIQKQSNDKNKGQAQNNQQQIVVSMLNLSQEINDNHEKKNYTQRCRKQSKNSETLPSQKLDRNIHSQKLAQSKKIQGNTGVSTTPFNLSTDNKSNMSFQMQHSYQEESFRKKQNWNVLQAVDISTNKQGPKTPQVKLSISEFINKQQQNIKNGNRSIHGTSKENSFKYANPKAWEINNKVKQFETTQQICGEQKKSQGNQTDFRRRQVPQTNSISNSNISYKQSIQNGRQTSYLTKRLNQGPFPTNQIGSRQCYNPNYKPQSVSNSFTQACNGSTINENDSLRQMMINNGHRGLAQSTTFAPYPNYVYVPLIGSGNQHVNRAHANNYNAAQQPNDRFFSGNATQNNIQTNLYQGSIPKTMKASQQPYIQPQQMRQKYSGNLPNSVSSNVSCNAPSNMFIQNYNSNQSLYPNQGHYALSANYNSMNASYNPNQNHNFLYSHTQNFYNQGEPPKQQIQYKTKITKLLN